MRAETLSEFIGAMPVKASSSDEAVTKSGGRRRAARPPLGSANELQYFLLLARDLQILAGSDFDRLAERTTEVKRMLTGLVQKLKAVG